MFGVSFGEVMLIAVVALVVFDPRRLPEVLGTIGKWIAKLRRVTTEMRRQTGIDFDPRRVGTLPSRIERRMRLARLACEAALWPSRRSAALAARLRAADGFFGCLPARVAAAAL